MKTEILTACDHLTAAALNGVYQGILLTLLVACGLRWLGRLNAATRHAVWFALLLLLVSLIPAHYYLDDRGVRPRDRGEVAAVRVSVGEAGLPAPDDIPALPPGMERAGTSSMTDSTLVAGGPEEARDRRSSETEVAGSTPPPPSEQRPFRRGVGSSPQTSRASTLSLPVEGNPHALIPTEPSTLSTPARDWGWKGVLTPVSWELSTGSTIPRLASLILVAVWLAVAAFRLGVLWFRLHRLRVLKRASFPTSAELECLFQRLCHRLGVKRRVDLRTSAEQRTPVLLGFRHPVVLLPLAASPTAVVEELEPILRHELAHLCRRDDWVNLVQHLVQAVGFFHPAAWWVCRRLSLEREIACDDCVLHQGAGARTYALILANLADRISRGPARLGTGVSTSRSQLKERINMILNTTRDTSPRLAKTRLGFITSAAAIFAVLAIYAGPRLVLAQTAPAPVGAGAPPSAGVRFGAPIGGLPAPTPAGAPAALPLTPPQVDLDPAAPEPEVDAGPKFKPGTAPEVPNPGVGATVGLAPVPAVPAVPAVPPTPALRPPAAEPLPPPRANAGGGSIEKRLDRLERMMQSLLDRQNPYGVTPEARGANKAGVDPFFDEAQNAYQKRAGAYQELVRPDDPRADWAGKRTARNVAVVEADTLAQARVQMQEASAREIEALQKARESLAREVEKLDRQIQQLARERNNLEAKRLPPTESPLGQPKP